MKVIIFRQESGSVAVMSPSFECDLTVEEIAKKDVPEGCAYKIVQESDLPEDCTYFDAWEYSWPIKISLSKAHELKKDEMRAIRDPILKRLDVEFMRKLEMGLPTAEIASKKQELRDVTNEHLPVYLSNDTVDTFSKRLLEFRPKCLDY